MPIPHFRTADGKEAFADQLNIEVKDKQTQVTLHGRPARVQREKDSLSGPVITMAAESQHLTVMGQGKLTGIQQPGIVVAVPVNATIPTH